MQLLSILFLIILLLFYYLICREIIRRRQAEINLWKQSERERLINQIAQQIGKSLNLNDVLNTTVTKVREFLDCDRVLIYRIGEDGTGSAITETVISPYPHILGQIFPAEVFPRESHQAYVQGKIRTITNIEKDDVEECLVDFVKQFGVQAKLVVPIIQETRNISQSPASQAASPYLWGLLIAHQCSKTRQWQPLEVELMKQLATQVAIAIQQSELYTRLKQLNTDLENRVKCRTQELAQTNQALKNEILERQRTEQALRHTNQTLQSLIAASPRAIFTVDLEERVSIWNPAAEKMFGWQEAEIFGQPNPVIDTTEVHQYHAIKQKILQGTTPPSLEIRRQKKDGTEIDIVFSAAPLTDSENRVNGIVAVVADISEQKEQAEQLRLLQSVVINTNDAVLITEAEPIDEPGPRIIYVNEAFTRTTGYTLKEVIGKTPRILQGPKTNRQALAKVRAALATWQPITVETINYRKDGSEFWVEFSIVAVANKRGLYTHWISVQRDITERKRLSEISLALEREKELSAIKTRFFSMASHEFRTPLSTVLAAAQLMENSPSVWQNPHKRSRNLSRIQNSVKNMVQLLDDILTINRAETGKLEFNPQLICLEKLCRQCVEEIQLSAENKHQITFDCSQQKVRVNLDEKLMRSIMANLLSNAIKYSPQGGEVKVTLKFLTGEVQIQITDQGIGIPSDYLKQLFEPFHRGQNVRRIPGTGLGLLIVKKFVDLHHGQINLTSEIDVGTTVKVTLPQKNWH
ncbi:PAS domain S-box protein [Waterburya agarophytonicola K14]|uniref:histidine kinase n=1 Tax=Waterburya agarophytonicola KI4 TaxID=2874699 RepID=A0A964FIE3_9CYAN|nr:PAS domain S-box protein [Waterburya agarophytonicola]MCC0178394.1 PAS domain S-box protein [Waterburya agarophytonicola KI4]